VSAVSFNLRTGAVGGCPWATNSGLGASQPTFRAGDPVSGQDLTQKASPLTALDAVVRVLSEADWSKR
jgi:hypothetical protein